MNRPRQITRAGLAAALCTVLALVGAHWANASEVFVKPSVKEAGKLRVGNTLDYAPFEFLDENNEPTGIDIELAQYAAKLMGVELEIVRIPFVNALPSLVSGRSDIFWASFTIREDRLEQVDFVAFMVAGSVVSTTPDRASSMQSQMDLCGKSLAIPAGGSAAFTAEKLSEACTDAGKAAIESVLLPEVPSTIQAVLSGRVDGRLDDSTASGYYEVTSGGQLVVVPGIYDTTPAGVAVPKGDGEAAEMVRSALQALIDNGSYAEVFESYGMEASTIPEAYVVTEIGELR